jgi:hypothetical protein
VLYIQIQRQTEREIENLVFEGVDDGKARLKNKLKVRRIIKDYL